MTENQEEELFRTLGTLVNGVNQIQSNVRGLKSDVGGLQSDVRDIKDTLNEHSRKLDVLVAKTDSIAGTVMDHETRLRTLEELGGKVQ